MKETTVNQNRERQPDAPLVSVLVPSYNHESYIIECLESIKDSNYKRIELIVSDDRSTDRTYALAEAWVRQNAERFERAVVLKQEVNLGVVKNLQFLFDNAQGEYLAYLASDDMLTPSGITDRLEVFERDSDADAVFGDAQVISESGDILKEQALSPPAVKHFASKKMLFCALLRFWSVAGPIMMLRKTAVLDGGSLGRLPDDLSYEDRYIYIRLAAQRKLRFVDRVVARYRIVDRSMSRTHAFPKVAVETVLNSDRKNLHLLTGLNRLYLAIQIARSHVQLKKHTGVPSYPEKLSLQIIYGSLRIASGLLSRSLFMMNRFS